MKRTTNPKRQTRSRGLLVLLLTLLALTASAAPVTPERAARVAEGFWRENPQCGEFKAIADVSQRLGFATFYTFEVNGGEGFVLVAADDRARPVLAYGFSAVPEQELRPNVRAWLSWYDAQLSVLKESSAESSAAVAEEWSHYQQATTKRAAAKHVNQLLTTQWDQCPLYNAMCPYDEGYGEYAVTGCSATATAQVMKYWNYPPVGNGSHSYTEDDYGTLTANFGTTHYDWDNMPNRLTYSSSQTEIDAVALLMYHVGVSIEMDYSPEGSGAWTISFDGWTDACSEVALKRYFDYKPTLQGLERYYYSDSLWVALLKNELDHARPVICTGNDTTGGHAFVCDGYDDQGCFHFNWGWSGAMDGYFRIDTLNLDWGGTGSNESISFNLDQTALIGIEPNADALRLMPETFDHVAAAGAELEATLRTNSGVSAGWQSTADCDWVSVTPASGNGNGEVAQLTITVAPNPTEERRTAHITFSQGDETKVLTIVQKDVLGTVDGWVGNSEQLWSYETDGGKQIIICSERFGAYRPSDYVTKVRFVTVQDPEYTNDTFSIRIYRNPTMVEDIPDIQNDLYTFYGDRYLGELAYEQEYVQEHPGNQVVRLATPYQIGESPFWIGVYAPGKTLFMYNYTDQCATRMSEDEYPDKACALENYRYLTLEDSYGYNFLAISYVLFCDNEACDTVVQGNVDFTLDFYVESDPVGIETAGNMPQMKVYPNPVRDELHVDGCEVRQAELIDMMGRSVRRWQGGNRMRVSGLPSGVYMLRVRTDEGVAVKRVAIE